MAIILLGTGLYLASWMNFIIYFHPYVQVHLWVRFTLLTALMTAAQMFRTEATTHQIFHPNLMFAFAGVILLPPFLFCTMIIISHLLEWSKERLRGTEYLRFWYLQPFNIGMHILVGTITRMAFEAANTLPGLGGLGYLLAVLIAAGIYVFFNHLIVGTALVTARGVAWRDSGILQSESLAIDFAMMAMGITVVTMIEKNIWLVVLILAPLYLIYRALAIPDLKRRASTDQKTGLWNAEYFRKTLEAELHRALRFSRPMVVVMADLDLLRNINNVYGHLAGDAVLVGVAKILKMNLRDYDTVSRFGGEEFAILMLETTLEQAYPRIEAIREQIASTPFYAPLTNQMIKITMSFGITQLTSEDQTTIDLIHRADLAVYAAKIRGRNQTCISEFPNGADITLEERISEEVNG